MKTSIAAINRTIALVTNAAPRALSAITLFKSPAPIVDLAIPLATTIRSGNRPGVQAGAPVDYPCIREQKSSAWRLPSRQNTGGRPKGAGVSTVDPPACRSPDQRCTHVA
ncbi:hypothetical protein, partial [Sphingomonas sp. 66-10]|uniref:hypothetical protein n=1 Tax=Sphingomonas sp. 66-10 TaxID=1895848 RepID=UPI002580EBFA